MQTFHILLISRIWNRFYDVPAIERLHKQKPILQTTMDTWKSNTTLQWNG